MKVIVCVDTKNGMMFNNRRQSQDRILRQKIAEMCSDSHLYLNEYSAKMFDGECRLKVSDNFLSVAGKNDYCFVEDGLIDFEKVDELFIFNWNRKYPADTYFEFDAKAFGFVKTSKEEFAGSSHEKITLEIYTKKVPR